MAIIEVYSTDKQQKHSYRQAAAQYADLILVMKDGSVVEKGIR